MSKEASMSAPIQQYEQDQTGTERFLERAKREPFIPFGIAACAGSLGYAAYTFRTKTVPTTVWVQQMRVQAQGMVVGAIIVGVGMKMWQESRKKKLTEGSS